MAASPSASPSSRVSASAPRVKLLINGEWLDSTTTHWRDVINPATQEVLARVPLATTAEVNRAVAAAKQAFKSWRKTPIGARARIFLEYQRLIREHMKELAAILTPFCLLAQYAIISFERSDFFFSDVIVWRILGPGLIAMVTTPFVFLFLSSLSHLVGFRPQAEVTKLS